MVTTASWHDAALRDAVQRLRVATVELDGLQGDRDALSEKAVELALALTRSDEAVLALAGPGGGLERQFSRGDRRGALDEATVAELLHAAGAANGGGAMKPRVRVADDGRSDLLAAELRGAGRLTGVLAVRRTSEYAAVDRDILDIFAAHTARALDAAAVGERQSDVETALVELRASLERQEATAIANADSARTVERVERAHELAVQVLLAVSAHAVAGPSLSDFYRRLATTVGELVGARRVLFWRLTDHTLTPIPGAYGIDDAFLAKLTPVRCDPEGDDLASRVVYQDLMFRTNRSEGPSEFDYVLERLGVGSAISVPWRAGEERLGLLSAYDSTRPGGFSREDAWVLQKAGIAAALVTQLWQTQESLRKSVERLSKVDAARQLLLKNMTTVVDKERKRFVSELHDDALQKLTAAEMQLGRLASGNPVDRDTLETVRNLLEETESALRRLVFEVHPPSLESQDGLAHSIAERLSMVQRMGIEAKLEFDLPEDLSGDLKAMLFRQISEAVGNVERHSKATLVRVKLAPSDGGVLAVVEDNGQGFVVAERANLPGHLGLLALKERTLMAGGRYKIESEPGAGTRIEFWVPLA